MVGPSTSGENMPIDFLANARSLGAEVIEARTSRFALIGRDSFAEGMRRSRVKAMCAEWVEAESGNPDAKKLSEAVVDALEGGRV